MPWAAVAPGRVCVTPAFRWYARSRDSRHRTRRRRARCQRLARRSPNTTRPPRNTRAASALCTVPCAHGPRAASSRGAGALHAPRVAHLRVTHARPAPCSARRSHPSKGGGAPSPRVARRIAGPSRPQSRQVACAVEGSGGKLNQSVRVLATNGRFFPVSFFVTKAERRENLTHLCARDSGLR